jgi:predicted ABC-type transport system involved in lysophospholipase L1 biosynthesis ATPase subunit
MTPHHQPAAFEAENLHKSFRLDGHEIPVLRGVNLSVRDGEWVALVGASGSGKSTLLHLLGTLEVPSAGEVHCLGRAYSGLSRRAQAALRRQELGFVFQSFHLFPELDAQENVALPALQWGCDRRAVVERARALLTEFGLGPRLEHRPQELSGGEQQRVALARALIHDPRFLLTDEPTGNLDAAAAAGIIDLLERLNREQGKTIVMVTHDAVLAQRADRVLRLTRGTVSEDASA